MIQVFVAFVFLKKDSFVEKTKVIKINSFKKTYCACLLKQKLSSREKEIHEEKKTSPSVERSFQMQNYNYEIVTHSI